MMRRESNCEMSLKSSLHNLALKLKQWNGVYINWWLKKGFILRITETLKTSQYMHRPMQHYLPYVARLS